MYKGKIKLCIWSYLDATVINPDKYAKYITILFHRFWLVCVCVWWSHDANKTSKTKKGTACGICTIFLPDSRIG